MEYSLYDILNIGKKNTKQLTNYEFNYVVDDKYCVFIGSQHKFDSYISQLMSIGYRVIVLGRTKKKNY